jgi:hypothetical protein
LQKRQKSSLHLKILQQQLGLATLGRHLLYPGVDMYPGIDPNTFFFSGREPMDWVKPKHRAGRAKASLSEDADNQTAMQWLEKLCVENVSLLQSSLPVEPRKGKAKTSDHPSQEYLQAMLWGITDWEVAKPANREFLQDLVDAFGPEPFGYRRTKNALAIPAEIRSQQVAHATKIGKWITQQLPKSSYDPYVALTCAGWLYALPEVGRDIPPTLWLEVLQSTLTQVDRAWTQDPQDGLFPWVIWACEVPLALAKQMSHLGGKDRIVTETLNRMAMLLEQTAEEPHALLSFGAQDLRAFVASMLRSRWAADSVGARKWYPPQRRALSKLQSIALHLTDGEGHANLSHAESSHHDAGFWHALMDMCKHHKKIQLASAIALPDDVGKPTGWKPNKLRRDRTNDARLPKPSHYFEKNNIISMRRNWRKKDGHVVIDFSQDALWLDISDESGKRLICGDWDIAVERNGVPIDIDVTWNEVCWFSDDDVDYLELECDLEGQCTIYRQLMLMREESMIYMADSIFPAPSQPEGAWKLTSSWTLPPNTHFESETKSNEGRIYRTDEQSDSKPVALFLPLCLPEWKRGCTAGSVAQNGDQLVLESLSNHPRQFSAALLALGKAGQSSQFTWRPLTIAQELKITSRESARAVRVQIDSEQWVFYRSLTPCIRRTVMGLHLNMEFYAGRFSSKDGTYEALVEVCPD